MGGILSSKRHYLHFTKDKRDLPHDPLQSEPELLHYKYGAIWHDLQFPPLPFLLPEIEIKTDDSLGYTVKSFVCFLPEDHPLYIDHRRSVRNIAICRLVKELESCKLCCGVDAVGLTSQLFHHVFPIDEDPLMEGEQSGLFSNKGYWSSKDCCLLHGGQEDDTCPSCMVTCLVSQQI